MHNIVLSESYMGRLRKEKKNIREEKRKAHTRQNPMYKSPDVQGYLRLEKSCGTSCIPL